MEPPSRGRSFVTLVLLCAGFFAGRNSNAFQCAGLISPRLRTLMLPRELLKKRGSTYPRGDWKPAQRRETQAV